MTHDQAKNAIDKMRMTKEEKTELLRQWDFRFLNVRAVVSVIAKRQAMGKNIHNGENE
jgi:hypothetical protein